MNAPLVVEEVATLLRRRYGKPIQVGRSNRLWRFGEALVCSINYSKLLFGHKFFFGLSQEVTDESFVYPHSDLGEFVILVCGSVKETLVLPRDLVLRMLRGVKTRKLDVFREGNAYVLQTTKHPKLNVTEFLNAFPKESVERVNHETSDSPVVKGDRIHVKIQSALIDIGRAEGCSVWVPPGDRNLSFSGQTFSDRTIAKLPNFGFDENTRRIVHNIDVLWLSKNVIRKAFEVESSTTIYSGLLRLNDLVLSQPNNQIHLYIAASKARRQKVLNQLVRPSFHSLLPQCEFVPFEDIEVEAGRIVGVPIDRGARVSGLIRGEKFELPEHYIYPAGL